MKTTSLFFSLVALCFTGCASQREANSTYTAPYANGSIIPPESSARAYLQAIVANPWVLKDKDKAAVCGAVSHPQVLSITSELTVAKALKIAELNGVPNLFSIAVWKVNKAALFEVQTSDSFVPRSFGRTLKMDDKLKAGDVIVVLERLICF